MICNPIYEVNYAGSHGSNQFLSLCENLGYIDCNHYYLWRTMNRTQKTQKIDSASGNFVESEMAGLLQMTNQVVMKIREQTKETFLWPQTKQMPCF